MSFVRINDILLHYRLSGSPDRPVVVLVNSLGTDARIWDEVICLLEDRYRILSYDKRGHGLSDAPSGDYAIDHHVDDLVGLIAHLGIERPALAGVSVGGLIALRSALQYPGQVAALILCDTAAKIGDKDLWNARIKAARSDGMTGIAGAVMDRWFTKAFRRDRADELAGWQTLLARIPVDGYAGTCAALRDTDLRGLVGQIAAPTLFVVGDQDLATPVELVRDTAKLIAGARFEIIADSGHIPSIEQPASLAKLMSEFLNEVGHD